ncbi:hypothetical protein RM572_21540 [Streptomyces sp. DSM 42041]|uniref:Uncharacterized protein n=1 Tax=Streptomyces hazeniae TaxID=3075538 RepID=A0ABU2NWH2_9ACTN|nr:hypothetical protein [Streptomyces sp. DSM 42041]MDT0381345.1 hypothetical protein [Streptomyces sp. DSM 42041]
MRQHTARQTVSPREADSTALVAGPAGEIRPTGRAGRSARAQVLAGLNLGTGLVPVLNEVHTSVSVPVVPS